ncbi:MAG TPA: SRPBCC family protein [Verrucomicrobiae bacterium]|jgi:hypothetical protein
MKSLKRLFIFLIILVLALVVVSQFLPGSYHVERSIAIKARPEAVYPWVANLKKWQEWSAWTTEKFPQMKTSYEGPEEGVGAISKWDDPKAGDGTMTVTKADPAKGVEFDLSFHKGTFQSKGALLFSVSGDETRVTWTTDGTISRNPLHRFFGLAMEKMMAPDFEAGLGKLKQKVEGAK